MNVYRQRRLEELRTFVEKARRMEGWTFDDVQSEAVGPCPPWDYVTRAKELISEAQAVLDMGTGGGELFWTILEGYQGRAFATESWPPNVPIASERLSLAGASLVHASSLLLPFPPGSFDLVLNMHEELSPSDVARVLAPGGRVLTQQVGLNEWQEIAEFFPRTRKEGRVDQFQSYQAGFKEADLTVTVARSHDTPVAYRSLGDVVYMFEVVMPQWRNHGFDLDQDLDALLAMEQKLADEQGIVLTESRYIIEAVKGI